MFTYDHNKNILYTFCENWRPSTNTVSTIIERVIYMTRELFCPRKLLILFFSILSTYKRCIDEVSFWEWIMF
ncbi:hypothetical protein H5410_002957 [Solanum commersonii]|uniref:Uncharacterized protein n=1 Tax=Solanum commersonii TaxID=4109 RepID=A0A9J6B3N6_SOLCO|nr:hypothetical protein H5410_002957 [Solanum commersonii]